MHKITSKILDGHVGARALGRHSDDDGRFAPRRTASSPSATVIARIINWARPSRPSRRLRMLVDAPRRGLRVANQLTAMFA